MKEIRHTPTRSSRPGLLVLGLAALTLGAGLASGAFRFDLNKMPDELEESEHLERAQNSYLASGADATGEPAPSADLWTHQNKSLEGDQVELDAWQESENSTRRKRLKVEAPPPPSPSTRIKSFWSRVRNGLPNYFDFGQFKERFKRRYKSTEAYLRQSIFLQKCFAVFKARVEFRLGKRAYLQSVNRFSDRTAQEFGALFMATPPIELLAEGANETRALQQRAELVRRRLLQLEELNGPNYVPELQSQAAGDEEEAEEEAEEDGQQEGGQRRHKLNPARLLNEQQVRQLIESLHASAAHDRSFEEALLLELDGFNVEMESQSAAQSEGPERELPWPGRQRAPAVASNMSAPYAPPKLAPGDSLDWSRHDCFHEVYTQGINCGKCYVMAATSLAEFYKCSERGPSRPISRRKFSKEYVLECSQKFTPNVMGCAGGSPLHTLRFISAAGIFNIRDWRQRRTTELGLARQLGLELDPLDLRCPLNPARTPLEQWGPIRVRINPKPVGAHDWKEALEDGPLVASVQMPAEGVDSYAGGVHDGRGCHSSNAWHAMLLVGYGTSERGQPFWRFRNSFGPDWGDAGHFNLAMDVPGACLPGGVRVYRESPSDR